MRGKLFLSAAILLGCAMSQAHAAGRVVNVRDFGAKADDGQDDTAAVVKAIQQCRRQAGSTLLFPKGRYDFFADPPQKSPRRGRAMVFRDCQDLVVDGGGSTLLFHGVIGVMGFDGCRNVRVKNFTIDWDRPPFSNGTVVAVGPKSFDVKVLPEFPVQGGEPVGALMEYDPATRAPARMCIDVYNGVDRTELLAPQVLRLHLKGANRAKVGMLMVLRHEVYGPGGISFNDCRDAAVSDVTIHTVPGMGVTGQGTTDIRLTHVRIAPREGSDWMMTATADATHFNGCGGTIVIEGCTFQGMGDDATNVHGMFHRVTKLLDDRTVQTKVRNDWLKPPRPGMHVEFTDPATLLPYGEGVVKSVSLDATARTHEIAFEQPVPKRLAVSDALGVVDWAPKLEIRNCRVIANRARGFLVQTRDAVIENNTFTRCQASGINVTTDFDYWTESIGTRKIVIRNNTFEELNNGSNWHAGAISVFADAKGGPGAAGVHRDILIEGNILRDTDGAAIYVASADGVTIRNNTIENCSRSPTKKQRAAAIYLVNARNVTITANTVPPDKRNKSMSEVVTIGGGCDRTTIQVHDNKDF